MMTWLPVAVVAALALPLLALRLRLLSPLAGFAAFVLVWVLGGVLLTGAGALALRRGGGPTVALVLGVVLLLALALVAARARAPRIHDITTATEDPPAFSAAASAGRDLAYPDGPADTAAQQRRAYPDLVTLRVSASATECHAAAVRVAEALGWVVTRSSAELGVVEAYAETTLFRFVDDVVVRIRIDGDGTSAVDVRSVSRVGQSDLGANAERIRRFLAALQDELGRS